MDKYYKYFEENEKLLLSHLEEFVMMETPSDNKQLNDKAADWLKNEFIKMTSGKAKIISSDDYGNHVIGEYGNEDDQILILAHYDTVWKKGTTLNRPYTVDHDKAFGPGIFDMKSGLLLAIYAIKAIKDLNVNLTKKVVFIFDSDEEVGNPSSRLLIEEEAQKSERAFILEPSLNGSLKISRKGTAEFYLEIKGKSSHSGVDPERGISAIDELSKQIQFLHELNNFEIGNTVNVGVISGGTRVNVIAENAEAKIDVRAKTKEELKKLTDLVLNLKPINPGISLKVKGGVNREPLEYSQDIKEMFGIAQNISSEKLGFELTGKSTGGGSDGNITSQFIPTLDGLGAVGGGAHANDEHIYTNDLKTRGALLANLIEHYGI